MTEKFIKDLDILKKLKELISMGIIAEMIRDDAVKEDRIEIAKRLLKRGLSVSGIMEDTGLDELTVLNLQAELGTNTIAR